METLDFNVLYIVIEIYEKSRVQLDSSLTNREIANRLNITPVLDTIQDYRRQVNM